MKISPTAVIIFIVILIFVSPVSASYIISEFCPNGYAPNDADEYFIIDGVGSLEGWSVTDGKGTVSFPSGYSGKITVAESASSFFDIHGCYPDFEIKNTLPFVPEVKISGKFKMANPKDSLTLLYNGNAVQTVEWPDDVISSNGRVHVYSNGVWDERVYKIGQSRFSYETFTADKVTLFVSPDCSYSEIVSVIDNADSKILISIYEFTHPMIAEKLSDALHRGVSVTILAEGGPVGGIKDDEKGVLNYLSKEGADIYTIKSVGNLPARYRYIHNKYLIADDYAVIVLSENFKETGIPITGKAGNRGWGAVVYDSEIAEYFTEVFSFDISGYDIYPYILGNETAAEQSYYPDIKPVFHPKTIYNVQVTPVISPDTSFLVPEMIKDAKTSLDIQQAYISQYPNGAENEWLALVLESAKSGTKVRIILDGMYYNIENKNDNDELTAYINRMNLKNLAAKLITQRDEIIKIHNKGVIADSDTVLISSINWNYNSPNNNREAGLIIKSRDAAEYFTKVFNYDWNADKYEDVVSRDLGFDLRYILAAVISGAIIILLIIRRRK